MSLQVVNSRVSSPPSVRPGGALKILPESSGIHTSARGWSEPVVSCGTRALFKHSRVSLPVAFAIPQGRRGPFRAAPQS